MAGALCSSSQQLWDLHHFNPPCLPWPQTGAAAQASRSQHPEPEESHAGSLQGNCSSLPQVLNFPFLATFGCCHSHPGPQLQGQTRRDKARAARSPAATIPLGSWGRGKGSAPLFSSAKSGPGKFLTLGLAKPLKQQTPGLGFVLCHQRTEWWVGHGAPSTKTGSQGTHHRGTLPLCPQKHNPNPIPAPWGAGGWITGGWITGGGERAALGGSNPK